MNVKFHAAKNIVRKPKPRTIWLAVYMHEDDLQLDDEPVGAVGQNTVFFQPPSEAELLESAIEGETLVGVLEITK